MLAHVIAKPTILKCAGIEGNESSFLYEALIEIKHFVAGSSEMRGFVSSVFLVRPVRSVRDRCGPAGDKARDLWDAANGASRNAP